MMNITHFELIAKLQDDITDLRGWHFIAKRLRDLMTLTSDLSTVYRVSRDRQPSVKR